MIYLLIVSLVWAFSFGIIKGQLTDLDSNFVSFARMVLSFIIFLPFIRLKRISVKHIFQLIFLGMIQFGLMYVAYILAYQYLKAYQIALFTILTPIYVTFINDAIEKRFHVRFLIAAIFTILGSGIIVLSDISWIELSIGFFLMQISNIAFAFGQVYYRKLMKELPDKTDALVFVYLYFGAVLLTGIFSLITTDYSNLILTQSQILSLIYLGVIASGICFFLWNIGARKTNAGTLSVFNNLKIPLAILVSLLFFNETVNLLRIVIGGVIILFAMIIAEKDWYMKIKRMPSR
ncbi:MAG: EamA family transporter [Calditrichaceae bacterium]